MATELAIPNDHFGLTRTGLRVEGKPSYNDWAAFGTVLGQVDGAVHWWLGDWLNYGEAAYGEKYAQALEATTFAYQTLRNDASIAAEFDLSRRRDNLSWSHHAELAGLEAEEQERLLDMAEEQGLTRGQLREERRKALPTPAIPEGKYAVILADPPWQYDNTGFTASAESHYPTMSVDVIAALPVPGLCVETSVLFLWATSPLLPEALTVMRAWGFTYKCHFAWLKHRAAGIGWFMQTEHELLLLGTREGNPHPKIKPASIIDEVARKHSQKPDKAYTIVEAMYDGPYMELFARAVRPNWQSWGNEVPEGVKG